MAKYSCVYSAATGELIEIGPAGTVWMRSADPKELGKFKVEDGVEMSEATAAVVRQISKGGGGDGKVKTPLMIEAEALAAQKVAVDVSVALAKSVIDAAIAEVLAKPTVEAK